MSPYYEVSRRVGSNPGADYQSYRGHDYVGPRDSPANENMRRGKSPIPPSGGGTLPPIPPAGKALAKAADKAARSLGRKLYLWDTLKTPAYLVRAFAGAVEDRPSHPDYSPEMQFWFECALGGSDPGNWTPYLVHFAAPGVGYCGGLNAWDPDNPAYRHVGDAVPAEWAGMALTAEADFIGEAPWQQLHIVYKRISAGEATYKGEIVHGSQAPRNALFWKPYAPPWPQLDPMAQPIGEFLATPKPIPMSWLADRLPSGWFIPAEGTQYGYELENPRRKHQKAKAPTGVASPKGRDAAKDELYPTLEPAIAISSSGIQRIASGHHWTQPPKRTRERKIKLNSSIVRTILAGVNTLTEGFDFLDAIYKALPKDKKRLEKHRGLRQMRPQHKLEVLWENWGDVSMKGAIKNIIENEVEDRFFGGLGQGLTKLNRDMGRPVGVQTGAGAPGKVPKGTNMGKKPWDNWTDYIWP